MTLPRVVWICLFAAGLAGAAPPLVPVPPLTAHVSDPAGLLGADQRTRLDATLADYEAKTGSQIAVLLVKSTEPESIEQYGIRVADAWKLGRKGVDDGVLLLVAKDNPAALRRLRIETGRGVQGVLTDAQSKRILQDVIAPHFQKEHYYEGLLAGVGAISTLLDSEKFPAAPERTGHDGADGVPVWLMLAGVFLLFSLFRGGARRRSWGSGVAGFIIGNAIGGLGRGGGMSGGGGGGMLGGGGSFDGGGASGNW